MKTLCGYSLQIQVLALALLLALSSGCGKGTLDGSPGTPQSPGAGNPPIIAPDPNQGANVRKMAADADSYAITYGALDPATIQTLKTYPLVIVHPFNGNITRSQIMQIKQGTPVPGKPDVHPVVLCYVSIGEDSRTFGLTDEQIKSRFRGDGSGPSIDPRGAGASGMSLVGLDPIGTPTYGGYASYYLNDNAVRCKGAPDKIPDQNGYFAVRFVNAGDPAWYTEVNSMLMDEEQHTPPGLKEMLTSGYGRGLSCDGVFLDTVDTAAPNFYTECDYTNHTSSEWTAQGFVNFMKRLRNDYPDKVILQNRGLFYFDPRRPHYQVTSRGVIDLGFFESYYLDNNSSTTVSPYYYDNKYNVAPKLMAEANRPDGFKVLSLGYANGFDAPKAGIDIQTLLGNSNTGYDILMTDLREALAVGFRHYITSASVDFVNSFVKNNEDMTDVSPPEWSSAYNAFNYNPILAPVPRVGIQKVAVNSSGNVTLSWDVALDMNRVSYVLYYRTSPFDFAADPALATATRVVLNSSVGEGYSSVWSSVNPEQALQTVYPYQATITGLQHNVPHYFLIRAVDSKGNEDDNRVVLTATP